MIFLFMTKFWDFIVYLLKSHDTYNITYLIIWYLKLLLHLLCWHVRVFILPIYRLMLLW